MVYYQEYALKWNYAWKGAVPGCYFLFSNENHFFYQACLRYQESHFLYSKDCENQVVGNCSILICRSRTELQENYLSSYTTQGFSTWSYLKGSNLVLFALGTAFIIFALQSHRITFSRAEQPNVELLNLSAHAGNFIVYIYLR